MDADVVIGRLYKTLLETTEEKQTLIQVLGMLKQGVITLDHIGIENGNVSVEVPK